MSALAWTLRNWRDESWPLFGTTNSTSSHTPKGGALSKNGLGRSLVRSTMQRRSKTVGGQRGEERVISGVRGILPGLGYPGGKMEVVGSSGATSPRRSADVRQAHRHRTLVSDCVRMDDMGTRTQP